MPYRSARNAFMQGVRTLMPLTPGVIPFGLVTGVMAIEMGMSPTTAMGMTLIFYSGSAQMVALQLLHSGALPLAIVLTALNLSDQFASSHFALARHIEVRVEAGFCFTGNRDFLRCHV